MKTFTVYSDCGGAVHFGSANEKDTKFGCLYYPTTFGDGEIKVIVCTNKEHTDNYVKKDNKGRFFGVIKGRFHLYEDDCTNEVLATFEGEYYLYDMQDAYDPTVLMVEPFNRSGGKIIYEKPE